MQVDQDQEHLKILSVLYYVYAGLMGFMGLFFVIYIFMGGMMVAGSMTPSHSSSGPAPAFMGWLFIGIGVLSVVVLLGTAALSVWTGLSLRRHRNKTLCFVVAIISCMNMPLGTALGVFTLVVLSRPSVKELFEREKRGDGEPQRSAPMFT